MSATVSDLVEQVAHAVGQLRTTLEKHELPGLEAAILKAQQASQLSFSTYHFGKTELAHDPGAFFSFLGPFAFGFALLRF